jgi:hypothetical protein
MAALSIVTLTLAVIVTLTLAIIVTLGPPWPGWANVPKVCTPWTQDFVISQGRRNWLLYDDLDIYQFIQGCSAMVEQQQDVGTKRLMLSKLCSTLRDASFHDFESVRYAFRTVLSM